MSMEVRAGASGDMESVARNVDLVGPTVEDDIRRVIAFYGEKAVKQAVRRLTSAKVKRGRKAIDDIKELAGVLEADARIWLEGGDPFAARSNYSIAREYAEQHPGQSRESAFRRVMRKLAKGRKNLTLLVAYGISEAEYPYTAQLKTLKALEESGRPGGTWNVLLHDAENCLIKYKEKFGSIPDGITMNEIELRLQNGSIGSDFVSTESSFDFLRSLQRKLERIP